MCVNLVVLGKLCQKLRCFPGKFTQLPGRVGRDKSQLCVYSVEKLKEDNSEKKNHMMFWLDSGALHKLTKKKEGHYYQGELSPAVIAVSSDDELQVRRRNLILYQKDGITAFPPRSSVAVPFLPNPG